MRAPQQARICTFASLRWVLRHRAWTPGYLLRYWRFWRMRVQHPDVVTEGFVFLGRGVELSTRPGYGRLVLGRWVHLGDGTSLRAHEGTLRIGDKTVFGRNSTVDCYLDVEIGPATIVADWVYITDFDHVTTDVAVSIKDQGIVKSPVRIGAGSWLGVKSSVLRGVDVGAGCVLAAHTVVTHDAPAHSVVGGIPGRVLRSRADVLAGRSGEVGVDDDVVVVAADGAVEGPAAADQA